MRVSSRDLRVVRREDILTRFAMLGPVTFVLAELPETGSAGTALEKPCQLEHWGFVLRGSLGLHARDTRTLGAGTAFYVPPGEPEHTFSADPGSVVAGFAPSDPTVDTTNVNLRRLGFEVVSRRVPLPATPTTMTSGEPGTIYRTEGSIELEATQMGDWVFSRTSFGPLSGYTSGWCDLPHWGMVLRGELALVGESDVELLTAGDLYYCPGGPPGHQFQVADSATTIDYTPIADLQGPGRKAEYRRVALQQLGSEVGAHRAERAGPAVEGLADERSADDPAALMSWGPVTAGAPDRSPAGDDATSRVAHRRLAVMTSRPRSAFRVGRTDDRARGSRLLRDRQSPAAVPLPVVARSAGRAR